jgi:hypothetical protein
MFTALDFSKYKTFEVVHGDTITSSGVGDVDLLVATTQGSLIFTARADSTLDFDNLQPVPGPQADHTACLSVDPPGLLLSSIATFTPFLKSTLSSSAIYVSVMLTAAESTLFLTKTSQLVSPLRKEKLLGAILRQTVQCVSW